MPLTPACSLCALCVQYTLWSRVVYGPLPLKLVIVQFFARVGGPSLSICICLLVRGKGPKEVASRMTRRLCPCVLMTLPLPPPPLCLFVCCVQYIWTGFLAAEVQVREVLTELESTWLERSLPVTHHPHKTSEPQ